MENKESRLSEIQKKLNVELEFKTEAYTKMAEILLSVVYKINKNAPLSMYLFKEKVLSKKDNPKEYYKALINFSGIA